MSDSVDALGGLLDAGLVAKALGRKSGKANINAAEIADAHHECANCGQSLGGNFCAQCGQQAHVHRSLAHVGEEFLHGITHFDGKTWQTLPMLLFRPGRLTREYIMGKRARYIAPVPLFLLVVFLMFFVFSFVHIKSDVGATPSTPAEVQAQVAQIDKSLAEIDTELAAARAAGKTADITALETSRTALLWGRKEAQLRGKGYDEATLDGPGALLGDLKKNYDNGSFKVNLGNEGLNALARKTLENPDLALYKIQAKIYKFSFLLVPLSLPWLWLMFAFRRNVRMYDHAVFALYSISFMSLLFVIGSIALALDFTNETFFFLLIFVAPAAHWYAQLKGAYSLGTFGAAWRTVALSFAAVMTLAIYLMFTLAIGLIG